MPGAVGEHYALVSELMPHKQIDDAIEAFNTLQLPLIVVGDGPDARRLRRAAGPTIRFTGRLPDASVSEILQGARALVVTAIEEFGIAAVESQAAGRPVIARRGGGALETIVDGLTGCFWSGGSKELTDAIVELRRRRGRPGGLHAQCGQVQQGELPRRPGVRGAGRLRDRLAAIGDRSPAACLDAADDARAIGSLRQSQQARPPCHLVADRRGLWQLGHAPREPR